MRARIAVAVSALAFIVAGVAIGSMQRSIVVPQTGHDLACGTGWLPALPYERNRIANDLARDGGNPQAISADLQRRCDTATDPYRWTGGALLAVGAVALITVVLSDPTRVRR